MRSIPNVLLVLALTACGSSDTDTEADAARATALDAALPLRDATLTFDASPRDAAVIVDAARPAATGLHYPISKESHVSEAPYFNITRPADLTQPGMLLPVVVWANGGCLRSDFTWDPLFERWAGAGYVVLSLTGELIDMFGTTSDVEHRALIDWVVAANASGPYAGKLDLTRIALAGNSCGGVTALQSAAQDKRAAAVFVLSGSSALAAVDEQVMKALTIPVGYVIGGDEDIAGPNARGDYAALREGVPAMIVNRREGDHIALSTDAMILPQDAEIALEWLDLALYGTRAAYEALTSPNVCGACTPGDWTLTSKHLETLL